MSSSKKLLQAAAGNAGESLYVEDVYSTYLYEGTGSGIAINNGIDLSGEGGLVIYRRRDGAENWSYQDTNRGVDSVIYSDGTNAAADPGGYGLASFNSNGFTTELNTNGADYASWTFRKAPKFFDVVTWVGSNDSSTDIGKGIVPHNLGVAPAVVIVKNTTQGSTNWIVYHKDQTTGYYSILNSTAAQTNSGSVSYFSKYDGGWAQTNPDANNIYIGYNYQTNGNTDTMVAYLFASDAGGYGDDGTENIIKCGSVTTDGSGNASVDVGFEPQWCLWKCIDAAGGNEHGNWRVNDVMRGWPVPDDSNAFGYPSTLYANTTGAETISGVDGFIKSATGFGFGQVQASKTYIYIAIRRPMKTPEAGTEVFSPVAYSGNNTARTIDAGFPIDVHLNLVRNAVYGHPITTRMQGGNILDTTSTDAEAVGYTAYLGFDNMSGLELRTGVAYGFYNSNANTYASYMFKRATGFMDVVCYTGTGSANTISHNLGVIPELIIGKDREDLGANWGVYCAYATVPTRSAALNTTESFGYSTITNSQTPTATSVTVTNSINASTALNVIYLFATLAGVSKVGSYTGTGSNVNVDCGFSAGARWVMIKSDATGDWYYWDSVRGIVAGNDPYLLMNSDAAQVTNTDYIDPLSSGFTVTSSAPAALNASGGNYIFLAIA